MKYQLALSAPGCGSGKAWLSAGEVSACPGLSSGLLLPLPTRHHGQHARAAGAPTGNELCQGSQESQTAALEPNHFPKGESIFISYAVFALERFLLYSC